MLDIKTLLAELKKLVTALSEDLLARSTAKNDPYSSKVDSGLREAYEQIEKGGRTADPFEVWREDYLDQVAVAWVLACVFVRFMEDNHLIDECWLAGEGERRKLAEDTHELYFRDHPHDSDREYFEHVFHAVGKIPAARDLFAEGKTPLWAVGPSGDMAMKLLEYWREVVPETGRLKRSLEVEDADTRFLGDLYQDLSERARKKYALLQTPVFVEEFILDRTLDPAIAEFGLDEVRMIDPTCGSGHFLLGGFDRLFDLWIKRETNEVAAAQKALDGVWGCDINPFAVAIARLRLIVAALRACGIKRLKDAPAWKIHLATGDSLLFGSRWDREGNKKAEQQFLGANEESWAPELYACEDKDAISEVLGQQYHAVVGNPPYITVNDKRLNDAYRQRYSTCYRAYSLGVPFTERFFDLCLNKEPESTGFVGMITANSFMKRIFGKRLIETFLPAVELTHVVDTSGAFIPGHTTSTVILLGRNRKPSTSTIRAVLGILGEPVPPDEPSKGKVWTAIVSQIDTADTNGAYISTSDISRTNFASHPWSIGGGGAAELEELLRERSEYTLEALVDEIGFSAVTREDDLFILPTDVPLRHGIARSYTRQIATGDNVRDWAIVDPPHGLFPYDCETLKASASASLLKLLWLWRTQLKVRVAYGKTQSERGNAWFEYSMLFTARFNPPWRLAFAEIATHNHFVLDEERVVFTQAAPIITFPANAKEDDFFSLLGVLNSSSICFWAKQVMPSKGLGGQGGGIKTEHWFRAYVFGGTLLKKCPIPNNRHAIAPLAKSLHVCAKEASSFSPQKVIERGGADLAQQLRIAREQFEAMHRRMVAIQEEIDWKVYELFGLCSANTVNTEALGAGIHPEERPVEQLLKSSIENGEGSIFYDVHSYRGTGEVKSGKGTKISRERLSSIVEIPELRLIELPDYKRRWQVEPWEKQQQRALKNWLLQRLETQHYWPDSTQEEPRLQSVAEIADKASGDPDFLQVAAIYRGREDFDVAALVAELVEAESVPFLPVLHYKPTGLRKRDVWEQTWELQRKEDAGEAVGEIKVPPKYTSADFLKTDYWRLRGKLDVPKERWISYPHCETESDPSLVVGWAGWNHLQQATALIAYYDARKREGWDANRLTPLLAGLDQLLPWIHQWHPEIDPEFGETAGQSYETLVKADAHELGLTLEQIRAWEPPAKSKGKQPRKARTKATKSEAGEDNHE